MLLFSPAKLNLFFKVLYKREDGFHEIASLYQTVSLGDYLSISLSKNDQFSCSESSLENDNLVLKALNLFRKKTKTDFQVKIHLEKNIPIEAGLGGGSSNAATTLWALNKLLNNQVSEETLTEYGAELGSDISFFFSNGTAMCRGRGEIFENQTLAKPFSAWLAKPNYGSKTPAVYNSINYNTLSNEDPQTSLASLLNNKPIYFNDLEEAAHTLEPRLKKFKQDLFNIGFSQVCMTGSGSAYFCLGDITPKQIPDVTFYPLKNLQRTPGSWYKKEQENNNRILG